MLSEWSATTRKSSGRARRARPDGGGIHFLAAREAVGILGPIRAPKAPASIEKPVCRCVSPQ